MAVRVTYALRETVAECHPRQMIVRVVFLALLDLVDQLKARTGWAKAYVFSNCYSNFWLFFGKL